MVFSRNFHHRGLSAGSIAVRLLEIGRSHRHTERMQPFDDLRCLRMMRQHRQGAGKPGSLAKRTISIKKEGRIIQPARYNAVSELQTTGKCYKAADGLVANPPGAERYTHPEHTPLIFR